MNSLFNGSVSYSIGHSSLMNSHLNYIELYLSNMGYKMRQRSYTSLTFFIILNLSSTTAFADNNFDYGGTPHLYKLYKSDYSAKSSALKLYRDCLEKTGNGTTGMINCSSDESTKQNHLLKKNYKKVINFLNISEAVKLAGIQRKWIKDRDRVCMNISNEGNDGKSSEVVYNNCIVVLTSSRSEEILNIIGK